MAKDLSHLIPSPGQMKRRAEESLESTLLKQLLKWLGVEAWVIRDAEKRGDRLDVGWVHGQFSSFPFELAVRRLKDCGAQEFFERPTKTPAFEAFIEEFGATPEKPCLLLFKAKGFTSLALFNSPIMGADVKVALRFRVREYPYFLSTMKEFCDAYRERSGALDS